MRRFRLSPDLLAGLAYLTALLLLGALSGRPLEGAGRASWLAWWPGFALTRNYDATAAQYAAYPVRENLLTELSYPHSLAYALLSAVVGQQDAPHVALNVLILLNLALNGLAVFAYARRRTSMLLASLFGWLAVANPFSLALLVQGRAFDLGLYWLVAWWALWEAYLETPSRTALAWWTALTYWLIVMTPSFWGLLLLLLVYALWRLWRSCRSFSNEVLLALAIIFGLTLIFPLPSVLFATYVQANKPLTELPADLPLGLALAWLGAAWFLARALRSRDWPQTLRWGWGVVAALGLVATLPTLGPLALLAYGFQVPHLPNLTSEALWAWSAWVLALLLMACWAEAALKAWVYGLGVGLALAAFVFGGWVEGLPLARSTPAPAILSTLADDPEDYVVAVMPVSLVTRAEASPEQMTEHHRALAWATLHHKRTLGGIVAQLSDAEQATWAENTMLPLWARTVPPDDPAHAQTMREWALLWRVGAVIAPRDRYDEDFLLVARAWLDWLNLYCEVENTPNWIVWRARFLPDVCPQPYAWQPDSPMSPLAEGVGWWPAEQQSDGQKMQWAGPERESVLRLWANRPVDQILTIEASALQEQCLRLSANGQDVGRICLSRERQAHEVRVGAAIFSDGLPYMELRLLHDEAFVIDGRALTALYHQISLRPAAP